MRVCCALLAPVFGSPRQSTGFLGLSEGELGQSQRNPPAAGQNSLISKPLSPALCSSLPPHITQTRANDNLSLQMVRRHLSTSHRQPPTASAAATSNLD